ncbi:MAG: hypothetical protein ABS95_02985 [Verrucomicrobia bacterium SCN 57-15]|nr:MAG: hypothetical protein ABS95_02985 [Verrucomicrobia bacterium SCN 57-15]
MATLMLAIFALASSHPLLEGLGLIHHETAHTHEQSSSDSDHPLADGKVSINVNRNDTQKSFVDSAFNLAKILAFALVLIQHDDLSNQSSVEIASSPPPELGTTWQFSSRAALPVRAPSFAS